jgi:arylsulfatase A-like enzyme
MKLKLLLTRETLVSTILVTASSLAIEGNTGVQDSRPNIIFIMADDLGYGDLGCYGQERIKTPNIDKLASEGMRFTQAYSGGSVCAPARSSLLTGMHNGNNRIRDNIPHGTFLQPDDFTIAELLKKAGYYTGGIGKYSLGNPGSWGVPNYQGFDYFYGQLNQEHAHFYYPQHIWENEREILLNKNRPGGVKEYIHDTYTDKAITYIQENSQRPFFLYLAYTIPHFSEYPRGTAEWFTVPSDEPYTDENWPQIGKNYAAMITRMDKDIGRLMELLKTLNIENNTLIIFTSDNGPHQYVLSEMEFFNSNGPLRGGKGENYEGGIRIPLIARWKHVIPEGTVNDKIIAFWDMLPTFADIIDYPGKIETDGISVWPALKGEQGDEHEYLYWDYGHVRSTFSQALRLGKYKLLSFLTDDNIKYELYDLEQDPGETKNLVSKYPDVVSRMKQIMNEAYTYSDDYPRKVIH